MATKKEEKPVAKPATKNETPRERKDKFPMVNVKALEIDPKKQGRLVPGKVYRVGEPNADALINLKRVIKAKANEKVGEIYPVPAFEPEESLAD